MSGELQLGNKLEFGYWFTVYFGMICLKFVSCFMFGNQEKILVYRLLELEGVVKVICYNFLFSVEVNFVVFLWLIVQYFFDYFQKQ